jgi:hypothetical protein
MRSTAFRGSIERFNFCFLMIVMGIVVGVVGREITVSSDME